MITKKINLIFKFIFFVFSVLPLRSWWKDQFIKKNILLTTDGAQKQISAQ
jgi:hypothetical protein